MDNLKYRRQFLFTPVACKELATWKIEQVDDYFLYVHSDCQFEKAFGNCHLYLIGYFFNPHEPNKTSKDILVELSKLNDIHDFPEKLYNLVGRFVLVIKTHSDVTFFNDACGLKTLYYTKEDDKIYAASQPLLIKEVLPLKRSSAYDEYFNSAYVAENIEHWVPSGLSFYEDVYQLVPNHYISASELEQKRYYPFQNLEIVQYADAVIQFASLLKKTVDVANRHIDKLAFSLTAGWDSRIILSTCKDIVDEVSFYTLRYRNMDDSHMDIRIPMSLSRTLKLKFDIFDCEQDVSKQFAEVYEANTDMAHLNDWGKIAFGMSKTDLPRKVAVKGNCSEIGRCYYFPDRKHHLNPDSANLTEKDFISLEKGWENMNFIREGLSKWNDGLKGKSFNYNLYDLFYWEHRTGSWQAQSQLEWDIVQEVFTPFNSRELLDLMLSIDPSKRKKKKPALYVDAMKYLWKEVLDEPINPPSFRKKLQRLVVNVLRKTGFRDKL